MTKKRRVRITEQELVAELHAHRDDPGEWSEKPVRAEVSQQRVIVTSFRLPATEFVSLQKAARASGETLSEFIRSAIALRLHGKPVTMSMQIMSGAQSGDHRATFLAPALSAGRTENPLPSAPDMPPRFAKLSPAG